MNFVNIAHSVVVMYVGAYTEDKSTKHTPTYYFIASIFLYYRSHSNNSCIQFHNHTENCLLFQSFVFFLLFNENRKHNYLFLCSRLAAN